MTRIYVKYSSLTEIGNECKNIASNIDKISNDFNRTIKRLDWDVRSKDNIEAKAECLVHKLKEYEKLLKKYQKVIDFAYDKYEKVDQEGNGKDFIGLVNTMLASENVILQSTIINSLGAGLKWLYEDKSGNNGASNLFNFVSKLSEALHLNDVLEEMSEFGSEWIESFDAIHNEKNSDLFKIGTTIDLVSETADTGGKIIGEIGKKVGNPIIKSVASIYSAIIEGYSSAFSEGIKSAEEYSMDGKFDMQDIASVLIDASTMGLFNMAESIVEDGVMEDIYDEFKIISDDLDFDGAARNFSDSLKDAICRIGENAGKKILQNPDLLATYEKTNGLGKMVMIFHAAIWK